MFVVDNNRNAEAWPKKLEDSSSHVISKYHHVVEPLNHAKNPKQLIMAAAYPVEQAADTIDDACNTSTDVHDVLVFPDNIRIAGVRDSDVSFVATHLLDEVVDLASLRSRLVVSELQGHHVFVCAHTQRDFRCACAGPKLIEWFQAKRPQDWTVFASSHYGGHRFAGNCIVYPEGHWYGLVNDPSDVDRVVHAVTVDKQPVVPSLWRGCINASKATQLALHREVACEDSATTTLV
ncbi:hypothetical protein AaE_014761 [Aphanomyces astaci]|uniref:Uncharacterized protein n=1 Tax=Aphanomyces astaci TaxID=112090 RepID=A0A6A4ZBM1_APHAT|nr:hypothetical protein AaE_014761 [Aphanomyces astaci]